VRLTPKKAQYPNLKLIADGMRGCDEQELSKHLGMPIESKYGFSPAKKMTREPSLVIQLAAIRPEKSSG
jgi:hypothetical protein